MEQQTNPEIEVISNLIEDMDSRQRARIKKLAEKKKETAEKKEDK